MPLTWHDAPRGMYSTPVLCMKVSSNDPNTGGAGPKRDSTVVFQHHDWCILKRLIAEKASEAIVARRANDAQKT
eukprot:482694-Amphidinium_carterae.1